MSATYALLDAVFLLVVALVAVGAALVRRGPRWRAVLVATVALVLVSMAFDNVMIGVGLVGYDDALTSGLRIGIAPLEDFAYAIAAAVLLPSVWSLLGGGRGIRRSVSASGSASDPVASTPAQDAAAPDPEVAP